MRASINLRGDLAKLSDAELIERLQEAWRAYEVAAKKPWAWLLHSRRGPIRHPRAYRFLSVLASGGGSWLDLLFAAALSGKTAEPSLRWADPTVDAHLSLCEIRDLTDEMERRVADRRAAKGTVQ
jgi:hypothetical protein